MRPAQQPAVLDTEMWVGGIPPHMTDKQQMLGILQMAGLPPMIDFYFRYLLLNRLVLAKPASTTYMDTYTRF